MALSGTKPLLELMLTKFCYATGLQWVKAEMCSERDSPLKRLYRRTHVKLTRLAGFGQLVWAAGCELSLALVHARRPAWPGETSETMLRVVPPRITRPPDHTRVNWPVDASASGSAQVGSGGRHRWAARVQVGREPARQKAREGYPSHYTSLVEDSCLFLSILWPMEQRLLRVEQNGLHFADNILECIFCNEICKLKKGYWNMFFRV